jgi:predicted RNase H-like HicB family nuclease
MKTLLANKLPPHRVRALRPTVAKKVASPSLWGLMKPYVGMDKSYTYTVKLQPAEEGGYVVTVPALPGCHTQGETYEEALANAGEAIQGFIEFLQKTGRPVPVESDHPRKLHLQVKVPVPA